MFFTSHLFFGDYKETIPIAWEVAVYVFFFMYGTLIVYEGVLEAFFSDDEASNWEQELLKDLAVDNETLKNIKTRGVIVHYVLIAAVIAITFGYIADQMIFVISNEVSVTFDNIYSWIAIITTNVIVGYFG